MAGQIRIGFTDPKGILVNKPAVGGLWAQGTTVPADATTGFAPGCIFQDLNASAGSQLYINSGTASSAAFKAVASNSGSTLADDKLAAFGTSDDVKETWDTTDANANLFKLQLPAGTAVNVPVVMIGQAIIGIDQTIYDGQVDPVVCLLGTGAVASGPLLDFRKARGTATAPTVVTSADDLGRMRAFACVAAGEWVQSTEILMECTGTIATTRGPGVITFKTATDAAPSVLTTAMTISAAQLVTVAAGLTITSGALTAGGTAYIGDTANGDVTLGLTINQGAADDGILALKSSDVAHGMTTVAETDSYGHFSKQVAAEGGLRMVGLSDTGAQALNLVGYAAIADATDAPTTTSLAATNITGGIANGTGAQTVGATGNLLNVRDTTNITTFVNAFVVKGDGELYSNQSATVGTFDDHDDPLMCADLSYALSNEYGKIVRHDREMFERLGILGPLDQNGQGMYSVTKMLMLAICAIGQLGRQVTTLASQIGVKVAPNGQISPP